MPEDKPPNARALNDEGTVTAYDRLSGDTLKIRWKARREPDKKWIEFSPADLEVELNGVAMTTCQAVSVTFDLDKGFPAATLSFTLEELDIDAETLIALEAFVDQQTALAIARSGAPT